MVTFLSKNVLTLPLCLKHVILYMVIIYKSYSLFVSILLFFCIALCSPLDALSQPISPVQLDVIALQNSIARAPLLRHAQFGEAPTVSLPLPEGGSAHYRVFESPVLDAAMSAQFPAIKTYAVKGIDDPTATGRFALTPDGFDAIILTEKGNIFIRKISTDLISTTATVEKSKRATYFCYYEHQVPADNDPLHCGSILDPHLYDPEDGLRAGSCGDNGIFGKNYRLVVSATGEFTAQHGGTVSSTVSYITTVVNALNAVYERDLAVHLDIVTANGLIYTSASADPYSPTAVSSSLLTQAQTTISSLVSTNNYDLGVVFHYGGTGGGGGVANVGSVCQTATKAGAWCSENNNYNQWLKLVMHEVGHQFGASHSFYGNESFCSNRTASSACEPGSGTTIMGYSGSCGSQNIGNFEGDTYFNALNLQQMVTYIISTATCNTIDNYGNSAPDATANPTGTTYRIPTSTPFYLTAFGSDTNADPLTYCWEQTDTDNTSGGAPNNAATSTTAPLFRSFLPGTSVTRTFPQLSDILNNTQTVGEILPQVARTLNFRVLVRDNHSGSGGIDCDATSVQVINTGSAFAITTQNSSGSVWSSGSNATVSWNIANTMSSPISCANVKISMSVDGGLTFPYTLVSSTPNDGSETFIVPAYATGSARVKVEAIGNIFFDINNSNITINSPCVAEGSTIAPSINVSGNVGASGLDLSLAPQYGTAMTSFTGSVAITDPSMSVTFKSSTTGGCQTAGNTPHYKTVLFSVNMSGNYTFTFNSSGSGGLVNKMMNLYQTAFSTNNTCTNWITSNGTYNGASVSLSSSITQALFAGTTYVLVVSGLNSSNVGTYTVNITPPTGASVYTNGTPAPSTAYAYTYIAINTANNIVLANASSNLTTLGAGTYYVYGLSYLSSALSNPNSLVGMSLPTLQSNIANGTLCADLSGNFVTVTITSSCPLTASFVHTLDQTEYDFNASNSVGATSYAWNFGDGTTGTGVSPSHTYTSSGTYNVTLTITGACGSTATIQTINFTCPADAAFTYTANGATYSFNAQNSLFATSYSWNFGDGSTALGIIASHTYTTQGSYNVTLITGSTCGAKSETQVITYNCPLSASFTYSNSGTNFIFNAANSTGNPSTYSWNFGDGTTGSGINPTHNYAASGNYVVTLTVSSACGSASTQQTMGVACTLSAAFTYSSTTSGEHTFNASNSMGASSYSWSFGDGTTATGVTSTHNYASSGTYTVVLTISGGCGSTSTQQNVTFNCPNLSPDFYYTIDNGQYNFGVSGVQSGVTYAWSMGNDSPVQNGTTASVTYTVAGNYAVCLGVYNTCDAATYCDTMRIVRLQIKAYLEGAYSPALQEMRTSLTANGLLPTNQPYNTAPWGYGGTETIPINSTIRNIATDWVLVEVLDSLNNLIERQTGIMTKYGDIKTPDGSINGLMFHQLRNNHSYRIVVRHRNHLPIVTLNTITVANHILSYDFSSADAQVAPGTTKDLLAGIMGMCAGDTNADGVINYTDSNIIITGITSATATNLYLRADTDMTGNCNAADFGITSPNTGRVGDWLVRY